MAFLCACQEDQPDRDLTPFIALAQQANCADLRNRVFEIGNTMTMSSTLVLLDHAGHCADASYRQTLYGDTVEDVLCDVHDSIAGPQLQCPVPSYAEMFQTIVGHLDDARLGLGAGFTVREVQVR
jgi:hypothetical protein